LWYKWETEAWEGAVIQERSMVGLTIWQSLQCCLPGCPGSRHTWTPCQCHVLPLLSAPWRGTENRQHKTGFPGPLASVLSLLAPGFDHGPFGGFHFHRNEKSRCLSSEGRTHYDVVEKGFYPSRCSFYGCSDGRNLSLVGEGKRKKTWCLGAYRWWALGCLQGFSLGV